MIFVGHFDVVTQMTPIAGTVPMWKWIGDEGATTFSY